MPKDWKKSSVGDLCSFVNGNGFKSSDWRNEGIPIIRIQNLNGSSQFNYFSGTPKESWIVKPGDILFAWAGTKGVSFGAKMWSGPVGVLNQHIFRVEPDKGVDRDWLFLALLKATETVERMAHGFKSTLLHVQRSDITEQILLVPPLPEQKKIAEILSTWDDAIAANEDLLANSRQRKKALMQQLLTGRTRLPGFEGEWQEMRLKECGAIYSGGTPDTATAEYWDGDINWLTPTDVTALKGRFTHKTVRQISESGLKNSSAKLLPPGSVMVCTRATVGEVAMAAEPICTNQGFKSIVPNSDTSSEFLYYLLSSSKGKMLRLSSGSTFLELSKKDFDNMEFGFPEVEEQKAIASILTTADEEIEALEQRINNLKTQKKALMQQLLTGKRRVKLN